MHSPEERDAALPERRYDASASVALEGQAEFPDILEEAAPAFEAALLRQNQLTGRIDQVYQAKIREHLSRPRLGDPNDPLGTKVFGIDMELGQATRNARIKGLDSWQEWLPAQVAKMRASGEDHGAILDAVARAAEAMAAQQERIEAYVAALESGESYRDALRHKTPKI